MIASILSSSALRNLVIMHQGALGDFLLALPVIEGLHLSYPDARIDFWTKTAHGDLLAGKPYAGNIHSTDSPRLSPFFHEELWKTAPVPASFLRCDAALVFGQEGSRLAVSRLSERLTCPVHWIRSFPDAACPEPKHVSRFLREQMEGLGWRVRDVVPRLEPPETERSEVRSWMLGSGLGGVDKPILIHPGSGGRRKVWPLTNWWAVLHWIRTANDLPAVVTLGPADEYLTDFALAAREQLGAHPVARVSLRRLTALLAESRFYLGSDSGVSHLAASVGIPTGIVFGPTDPGVWAPNGPNVRVIRSRWEDPDVLAWSPHFPVKQVEADVKAMIGCLLSATPGRRASNMSESQCGECGKQ